MKFLSFITVLVSSLSIVYGESPLNNRPIIGIVAQECHIAADLKYGASMITASYVKFLESAGARVVPIMINKTKDYYQDLLGQINGVLLPGGGDILRSEGYGRTGRLVFEIAKEINDKGYYFPVWGTCLGFELMNYVVAKKLWMKSCAAEDLPSNLNLLKGFRDSELFKDIDTSVSNTMQNKVVTINYHQWCLTPENYTLSGLDKFYKVLALNEDAQNLTYISIIEAHKYPFYGVQFHPEKVIFEWVVNKKHRNIPKTAEAIKVSQYFANFFVNEARKSSHHFPNKTMEDAAMIYNYSPVFSGKLNRSVFQIYYFP